VQRSIPLSSRQVQLLEEGARRVDRALLPSIQEISLRLRLGVYLVGGAPRDLILSGRLEDLDLLVEGAGEQFARDLAEALGGKVRAHARFGTAEVECLGGRLDIATARRESYDGPASLPRVVPGTLEDDLQRRDFTVNTLVIDLGSGPPYEIVDSYGAMEDIEEGRLRVLHDGSFLDDPTRVLRGLRFESRFGFRMDEATERLARAALKEGAFDALSGDRLRREVFRLLEVEPEGCIESKLKRFGELGLAAILHPGLRIPTESLAWIGRSATASLDLPADVTRVEAWRLVLPWLLGSLEPTELQATAERLALRPEDQRWLLSSREDLERVIEILRRPDLKPHEVDRCLRPLRSEQMARLLAFGEASVVQWVRRWLDEIRLVRLSLTGRELTAAGFGPGPGIGRALESTLEARLDGSIRAEEELGFALDVLNSEDVKAERG